MILIKEYQDLNDVLIHLKIQVRDSIKYCTENIPKFSRPESLFYWLKARIQYVNDPDTIELLMTAQTLLTGSHTGKPGAGDCDDFTILGLAALINSGFNDLKIVLVGRDRRAPVHIYLKVKYLNDWQIFDLTNEKFNFERNNYKYIQELTFKL